MLQKSGGASLLAAAAQVAAKTGLYVRQLGDALEGEARDLGVSQAQLALTLQQDVAASGSRVAEMEYDVLMLLDGAYP